MTSTVYKDNEVDETFQKFNEASFGNFSRFNHTFSNSMSQFGQAPVAMPSEQLKKGFKQDLAPQSSTKPKRAGFAIKRPQTPEEDKPESAYSASINNNFFNNQNRGMRSFPGHTASGVNLAIPGIGKQSMGFLGASGAPWYNARSIDERAMSSGGQNHPKTSKTIISKFSAKNLKKTVP